MSNHNTGSSIDRAILPTTRANLRKPKVRLYQATSGFFCVEQREYADEFPLFEYKLRDRGEHELSFPHRIYMVSAYHNYAYLREAVARSAPDIVLVHDLALNDSDYRLDHSTLHNFIISAIDRIMNSDLKRDQEERRQNIQYVIDDLWRLTEDKGTLILCSLWDAYPGLAGHLMGEYSRVIIDDYFNPFFLKGDPLGEEMIGPPYGRKNSVRHVCEQLERRL